MRYVTTMTPHTLATARVHAGLTKREAARELGMTLEAYRELEEAPHQRVLNDMVDILLAHADPPTHGGVRAGAGRPPLAEGTRRRDQTRAVTVRLSLAAHAVYLGWPAGERGERVSGLIEASAGGERDG